MNRYDWLMWIIRLLIGAANLDGVRALVRELAMIPDMNGAEKRAEVEKEWLEQVRATLPDALKSGAAYLLRAVVELALVKP